MKKSVCIIAVLLVFCLILSQKPAYAKSENDAYEAISKCTFVLTEEWEEETFELLNGWYYCFPDDGAICAILQTTNGTDEMYHYFAFRMPDGKFSLVFSVGNLEHYESDDKLDEWRIQSMLTFAQEIVEKGECIRDEEIETLNETLDVYTTFISKASRSNNTTSNGTSTRGEKNALLSAREYLDVFAFSYSGLIEQLEYEGYTSSEAKYAADNCGADWNEQAARSAREYLEVMAFSKSGLITQLEYEGFTHAQAVYGVQKVY